MVRGSTLSWNYGRRSTRTPVPDLRTNVETSTGRATKITNVAVINCTVKILVPTRVLAARPSLCLVRSAFMRSPRSRNYIVHCRCRRPPDEILHNGIPVVHATRDIASPCARTEAFFLFLANPYEAIDSIWPFVWIEIEQEDSLNNRTTVHAVSKKSVR